MCVWYVDGMLNKLVGFSQILISALPFSHFLILMSFFFTSSNYISQISSEGLLPLSVFLLHTLAANTSKLCIILVLICLGINWSASETFLFKSDFVQVSLNFSVNFSTVSLSIKYSKPIRFSFDHGINKVKLFSFSIVARHIGKIHQYNLFWHIQLCAPNREIPSNSSQVCHFPCESY